MKVAERRDHTGYARIDVREIPEVEERSVWSSSAGVREARLARAQKEKDGSGEEPGA